MEKMEKTKTMHLVSLKEAISYFRSRIVSAFSKQLLAFLPLLLFNKGAALGIKCFILKFLAELE